MSSGDTDLDLISSFSSFNDDDDDTMITREQRQIKHTQQYSLAKQQKTLLIRQPGWYLHQDTESQLNTLIATKHDGPHKLYTALKELRQVEMDKCAYYYARGEFQQVVTMIETLLAHPQHEATLKEEQRFQFFDILARSYYHVGSHELALPLLLRATQRRPADICNWLLLAGIYQGMKHRMECIQTYQTAVAACCHHVQAWCGLADAHRYFASLSLMPSQLIYAPSEPTASTSTSTSISTSSFSPSTPTFDLSLAWLCWHHLQDVVKEYRWKYDAIIAENPNFDLSSLPLSPLSGLIPVFGLIDSRLQLLDAYKEPVLPERLQAMDQATFDGCLGACAPFINRYVVAPSDSHVRVMRWQHHQQHVRPDKAQQRTRDAQIIHNLTNNTNNTSNTPDPSQQQQPSRTRKPRDRNDPDYEELTLQIGEDDDDDSFNPMLM